ncbi:hypothetical protein B0H67DRAFT_489583 [Lasiosphaeris hirsuta]|uniref:Uncharacterized protein n=1 Tax=Lasiosphaeris hirsuta TaxID=260670 RepID=A0AA40AHP0_9PEZI|nr:hypothetical protein B0H67DRAFT_489583 [Lasiosphaeris hirsuta]
MASAQESTQEIVYSREETVAAVQDFIAFATKMYLDESAYESPPSTGWPSITPDSMRPFDKTDEVVELLRHLPYPSDEDPDRRPQVMPALPFAAFQLDDFGQSARTFRIATEGMIFEHVPAHVVGLAMRQRNDHGVLLDTKLGVVFWHEAATEFKWFSPFPVVMGLADSDDDSEGEGEGGSAMSPGERAWRGCETVWSIPDFFATLKHNLKELHFVPMSRRRVVDGWYGPDEHGQEAVEMVKGIYRAHGWPDLERYRKEDCLKAIYTALSESFPGEEDEEDAELLEADS